MATLEIKSEEIDVELKYVGKPLLQDDSKLLTFMQDLRKFDAAVNLSSFTAEETPVGSKTFLYHFVAKDGREWTQTIKVSDHSEMNFDVEDFWRLSEFSLQRPIRDEFIDLVSEHGIYEVNVSWV